MAARNNADWYAMMADLHDCGFVRYREAFVMLDPPPPFHGWMTTLQPDATDTQIALVADHKDVADFAIKDGFDRLDLTGHAMKTGFTAEWINAERAVEVGIATRAFTDSELMEKTLEKAREIAQWPVVGLVETKKLMRAPHREAINNAYQLEEAAMLKRAGSPENIEAIMAFLEKRPADFRQFR